MSLSPKYSHPKTKNQKPKTASPGITNLALIVTVTVILTFLILVTQSLTLLTVKIGQISLSQKIALYAAESLLNDTILHLNSSNFTWPPGGNLNDQPSYISSVKLDRTITLNGDIFTIDITASNFQSTRRLNGQIRRTGSSSPTLDIVLVLDKSGSMNDEGCDTSGACQPFQTALSALSFFLQQVVDHPQSDNIRTGLVSFSANSTLEQSLTNDHDLTLAALNSITLDTFTNTEAALLTASSQLLASNPAAQKVIIMLTDGLPTMSNSQICNSFLINPDPYFTNPTSPTPCTDAALAAATQAKTEDITIYVIGLGLAQPHAYITQDHIDFAKQLINQMVTDPASQYATYTPDATQLQQVYSNILQQILANPYLHIQECAAGDACP